MEIEKGGVGHIKRLEKSFKNANFEQDVICYSNSFIMDVIGSRKVGTILKYKAANTSPHIEHRKSFHEKLGLESDATLIIHYVKSLIDYLKSLPAGFIQS